MVHGAGRAGVSLSPPELCLAKLSVTTVRRIWRLPDRVLLRKSLHDALQRACRQCRPSWPGPISARSGYNSSMPGSTEAAPSLQILISAEAIQQRVTELAEQIRQ